MGCMFEWREELLEAPLAEVDGHTHAIHMRMHVCMHAYLEAPLAEVDGRALAVAHLHAWHVARHAHAHVGGCTRCTRTRCTRTCMRMRVDMHMRVDMDTDMYMHIDLQHIHVDMHLHMHLGMHLDMHSSMHASAHLDTHTHMQTSMGAAAMDRYAEFTQGELIFRQGDPGFSFVLIREGLVSCVKDGDEVATLKDGDYVGERSLLFVTL